MVNTLLVALFLLYGLVTIQTVRAAHNHLVEHLDRATHHLKGVIDVSAQDQINAVVNQLGKAKGEIIAKLADLQGQIDAGVPTEELDLSALTEAAQALDDVVADVPAAPVDAPADPEA